MPALTYWTARLYYPTVSIDTTGDLDAEPQSFGTSATCIVTPFVKNPPPPDEDDVTASDVIATTLTPDPAMLVLAQIKARLDNGRLMIRAEPDKNVDNYVNVAAFPATGNINQLYRDTTAQIVYAWNGSAYVLADDFASLRLVAQTDVLGLPPDAILGYEFAFSNVTYPKAVTQTVPQLPTFCVAAPDSDVVLDLALTPHIKRK